jgi:hypothetical protein
MSNEIYIAKLNDGEVIQAFETVAEKFSGATIAFNDLLGQLTAEDEEKYVQLAAYNLIVVRLIYKQVTWTWTRLGPNNGDAGLRADKLEYSYQRGTQPNRIDVAEVSSALTFALSRPLASVSLDDTKLTLASHSDILNSMERVAAKIIADTAAHRNQLEQEYNRRSENLTAQVDDLRNRELDRVDQERKRIEAEQNARQSALDQKKADLDELKSKLDDRNNTHVRREIRSSLMALTKERLDNFAISKETKKYYLLINTVTALGLGLLCLGAFFYGAEVAGNNNQSIVVASVVKSSIFAATAIALGYWYIGWLNRWFQRIADAEFRLQQFRLDIERASWLTETVLEWRSNSDHPFPELLTSRLSAGLFLNTSAESDDPKSPATHLAEAIFGAASSAKIKMGDQELQLDRKSIKELER